MNENFIEGLDENELNEFRAGVEAAKEKVLSGRKAKVQASLVQDYRREMLAVRGQRHLVQAIRDKYARRGLDVGSVDFTE